MKILVALDLSSSTSRILERAKAFARERSGRLWLLHVANPDPDFVGYEAGPQTVRDAVAEKYHEEHREIQQLAETLRSEGFECSALLIPGSLAETILKEAANLEADLIVVGSHGRGMVRQLLLGSTSEAVIRNSQLPVLVIPTHDRGAAA